MLISSIRDDDPVVFIEHKALYVVKGPVPREEYGIPLGEADVKRGGRDVTVVATALMVHISLKAAEKLEGEGISVEVVDPRTLRPLDVETILNSIKKTGRLVVVDEGYPRCGFATDIVAIAASYAFDYLKAPVKLVTPPDTPVPFSPVLEEAWMPSEERIAKAVEEVVNKVKQNSALFK